MSNYRFLLLIAALSLLLVAITALRPVSSDPVISGEGPSDFHQRHPELAGIDPEGKVGIPVTGWDTFPDYYERHREQIRGTDEVDTSDYFLRHPEFRELP
ncbi:MAG TPA: hypothetical protein VFO91_03765 [Anaerolineales bacterium]|nr:hypothetical protein [Anaerolineales bacterium]